MFCIGPDGTPLRAFFSDVSVKLVGSNTWMNTQSTTDGLIY
jgi:hypothetical protein